MNVCYDGFSVAATLGAAAAAAVGHFLTFNNTAVSVYLLDSL